LRVARAGELTALSAAGSDAVVLLLLDTQHYGVLTAQIFFGLWLVPRGCLAHTSGWFPTALGVLLVAAGVGSLVAVLAAFLVPDGAQTIHPFVVIAVVAVAEIWMVLSLLVIGVRSVRPVSESAEALSSRPACAAPPNQGRPTDSTGGRLPPLTTGRRGPTTEESTTWQRSQPNDDRRPTAPTATPP
jgi:hypothetical protein